MNTMRVYLHNLLWEQDAPGFKKRLNEFLAIAAKHKIRPMFVLFDSCWDPEPQLGPQRPPIPGVHNSGWVQAPGRARLEDKSQYSKLQAYVEDVVGTFAKDERILAWDVWNEPSNRGGGNYPRHEGKQKLVEDLLDDVFAWARSRSPVQPLTSGVWEHDDWSFDKLDPIEKIQIEQSDVIAFTTTTGRRHLNGECVSFRSTSDRFSVPNTWRAATGLRSMARCRLASATTSR